MADRYKLWYDRLIPCGLAALALMGAQNQQPPLVALATTMLFALLVTRYWSHRSVRALTYERHTSESRAFPGDELSMEVRLSNDKLLPLPWVEIDDHVPSALVLVHEGEDSPNREDRLRLAGSLGWKERISWRYRLNCSRRGIYHLGPTVITSGDPFGIFPRSQVRDGTERLVVYPSILPTEQLGLPPGFPLGDAKSRRWIFEDPSRTVGVRDHRQEDGLRRIHWKATARRQQLQVKLQEPTTTLEVALFLGVDSFGCQPQPQAAGSQHAALSTQNAPDPAFEHAVSVVASLAHHLIGRRYPTGLYINGGLPDSRDAVELRPGGSQEQLMQILELLAGVQPLPSFPVETLLSRVAPRLPWGSSIIVVAGAVSKPLLDVLSQLAQHGQKPVVLSP